MKIKYIYWKDGDFWLGYLEDYPDYLTQGSTLEDLQIHLKDLFKDLNSGHIPFIRKKGELEVA
jgi:predicted RNase H-like HicB family nuclease